jgi:hypothetical protein
MKRREFVTLLGGRSRARERDAASHQSTHERSGRNRKPYRRRI